MTIQRKDILKPWPPLSHTVIVSIRHRQNRFHSSIYIVRAVAKYEHIRKEFTQHVVDSSGVVGKISTFGGFPGAVVVKSLLVTLMYMLGITKKKGLGVAIPKLE